MALPFDLGHACGMAKGMIRVSARHWQGGATVMGMDLAWLVVMVSMAFGVACFVFVFPFPPQTKWRLEVVPFFSFLSK